MSRTKFVTLLSLGVAFCFLAGAQARADTILTLDTFQTLTNGALINDELGNPRQSGTAVPAVAGVDYTTNNQGITFTGLWSNEWANVDGSISELRVWRGPSSFATATAYQNQDYGSDLVGKKYDVSVNMRWVTGGEWSWLALSNTNYTNAYTPPTGVFGLIDKAGAWTLGTAGAAAASGSVTAANSYGVRLAVDETVRTATTVAMYLDGSSTPIGSGTFDWSGSNSRYLGVGAYMAGNATVQFFDNLQISIVVPEPSSVAILASALVGLLCYAWRRRK